MTLAQLVELVCAKMHRTDAESQAEAKTYIRARYQMLWDSRPWRPTLGVISLPAADTQTIHMPAIMDRVLMVRWGTHVTLTPEQLVTMFIKQPTKFEEVSQPNEFTLIGPSALSAAPNGERLILVANSASANFSVSVRGRAGTADREEVIAVAGAGAVTSEHEYDEVFALAKNDSTCALNVKNEDSMTNLLDLPANEQHRIHQRIYLYSTPSEAETQFVIYKRRCRQLPNNSDATELEGLDNALLAAAISDMLEGQRHYGKASIKAQEASVLATAAADLEMHQSANMVRIIPWDAGGFGEEALEGKGYL